MHTHTVHMYIHIFTTWYMYMYIYVPCVNYSQVYSSHTSEIKTLVNLYTRV